MHMKSLEHQETKNVKESSQPSFTKKTTAAAARTAIGNSIKWIVNEKVSLVSLIKKTWKSYCKLRLKVQLCWNLLRHFVKMQLICGRKRRSDYATKETESLCQKGTTQRKQMDYFFPMNLLTAFWKQVMPKMKMWTFNLD